MPTPASSSVMMKPRTLRDSRASNGGMAAATNTQSGSLPAAAIASSSQGVRSDSAGASRSHKDANQARTGASCSQKSASRSIKAPESAPTGRPQAYPDLMEMTSHRAVADQAESHKGACGPG